MRHDFFFRTETNRRPWATQMLRPAQCLSIDLPADLPLEKLLWEARLAGMPSGSARSGCFEIQNDLGVWSNKKERRLNLRNATFAKWENL